MWLGATFVAVLVLRTRPTRFGTIVLGLGAFAFLVAVPLVSGGVEPESTLVALLTVTVLALLRGASTGAYRGPSRSAIASLSDEHAALAAIGLATALALLGRPDLRAPTRPPWYLLGLGELVSDLPPGWAGGLASLVGIIFLLVLPLLTPPDEEGEGFSLAARRPDVFLFLFFVIALGLAPTLAAIAQGPAEPLLGPLAAAPTGRGGSTSSLAKVVFTGALARPMPTGSWALAMPGLVVTALWMLSIATWAIRGPFRPAFVRRWRDELDPIRLAATVVLLAVGSLPLLTMALRLGFGISPLIGAD